MRVHFLVADHESHIERPRVILLSLEVRDAILSDKVILIAQVGVNVVAGSKNYFKSTIGVCIFFPAKHHVFGPFVKAVKAPLFILTHRVEIELGQIVERTELAVVLGCALVIR